MQERRNPGALERFLRLFTDVRTGEGPTALLLTLNVFLILGAYYFIKPVRDTLILETGGAELKSYLTAGQALLLLGAVPAYGALADRLPRGRLINWVTFFFVGCLAVFFVMGRLGVEPLVLAIVFYLWVGIFNLMVVAQFWSFANDVYTREEGERLFPIVAFGASAGAVVGALIAGRVIGLFGIHVPLLVGAGLLLAGLVLTRLVDDRERRRTEADRAPATTTAEMPAATGEFRLDTGEFRELTPAALTALRDETKTKEEVLATLEAQRTAGKTGESEREPGPTGSSAAGRAKVAGQGAFSLVFRYRYLLLIGLLVLLLNWVNTNGQYILDRVLANMAQARAVEGAGPDVVGRFIGSFYSNFYTVVNLLGMIFQLFLVSRVIKYLGVRVALLLLPVIALGAYALLAFYPVLGFVRWAKTAENATDYSLQNTLRQVLFLPTTREQKYKAKQAIDSWFVRMGDVLSGGVVFVGTTYLAMRPSGLAAFNLVLVVVWVILALAIGRRYLRLAAISGGPTPGAATAPGTGATR